MPHQLLLLHFGVQCPWQPRVVEQAYQAAAQLGGHLRLVDVSEQPDLAAKYRLFYPFMIVVDGRIRLPSPTPARELVRIATQGVEGPQLVLLNRSPEAKTESALPLTVENSMDTCAICNQSDDLGTCQAKAAWAAEIARQVPEGVLGFIAYQAGEAVGAVEVLPTPLIPYPLPHKASEISFITCLYSLENGLDYRGQVLKSLIRYLPHAGYKELQVIVGKRLPYPNGPQDFFVKFGFKPLKWLDKIVMSEGEDNQILLGRELK